MLRRVLRPTSAAASPLLTSLVRSRAVSSGGFVGTLVLRELKKFHPFSSRDEDDLVKVITTKPRHVLKHVRTLVWRSRKRELNFRNTVTQLMIAIQDLLRKQLLDAQHASAIMEGIIEECVKMSQHDMAHLLFRAFLRFRKYGCTITIDALRHLFESYRGTDNAEMMLQLAKEMSTDASLRAFCIAAYLFAGHVEEAEKLRASLPIASMEPKDVVAIAEGYDKLDKLDKVLSVLDDLKGCSFTPEGFGLVFKALFRITYRRRNYEAFDQVFNALTAQQVLLDSGAFATILRMKLQRVSSIDEIPSVEEQLKALGYVADVTGNSIIIAAYARHLHFGDRNSEEVMLSKVDTLLSSIESRLKQGDPDMDISAAHLRAVIRGYGAAGRPELMKQAWTRMQYKGLSNDTRVYNELLKWYSLMGNVKEALALRDEMVQNEVHSDAHTYTWLFRALGKWYPRQVEKLYAEMQEKRIRPDIALYTTLIGVMGDLQRFDVVEQIMAEVKRREEAGTLQVVSANTYSVLLRIYSKDLERVEHYFKEAQQKGVGDHSFVTTALISAYASHPEGEAKLQQYLSENPTWATDTYNVLFTMYHRKKQPEKVRELLQKMQNEQVEFNDVTFGTLITIFGREKDTDKVHEVIEMLKQREGQVSAHFYSVLAATYNRLGDTEGIDDAWEDLQASKLFPDTQVYNQFLSLYGRRNNLPRMQAVMDDMLKHVPPNPLTATTVVDMLGKAGRISEMEQLVHDMSQSPDTQPTSVTYTQVMNAYAKSGDVVKMEKTFEEMLSKGIPENAVTFNILADGFGRARRFEQLAELTARRKSLGIPMDELAYCVLVSTFGRARLVNEVLKLSEEVLTSGAAVLSRKVSWVFVDAFCRCQLPQQMQEWIDRIPDVTASERMNLIAYYCRAGVMEKAEEFVKAHEGAGEDISFFALNATARGYAKAGRFDRTVEVLHKMRDRNMVPDASTALYLSNAFLKAGLHDQAQQIVQWRRQFAQSNTTDESSEEVVV